LVRRLNYGAKNEKSKMEATVVAVVGGVNVFKANSIKTKNPPKWRGNNITKTNAGKKE